jgi:hypothetical protein
MLNATPNVLYGQLASHSIFIRSRIFLLASSSLISCFFRSLLALSCDLTHSFSSGSQ